MILAVHHRAPLRRLLQTALDPVRPVVTAGSAEEALEVISGERARDFHLLVAGLLLPGMGGAELAEHWRAKVGERAPVVLTSAYARPPAGSCDLFVAEPFAIDDVAERVRQLLEARELQVRNTAS